MDGEESEQSVTWVRIDDGFEDNGKVAPLSDSAHRVWLMANCWCKKLANFHTRGFVPSAMLATITQHRYKPTQLAKLVNELVNSRVGGTKENGLWEQREGGWQFHDWQDYLSKEDIKELEGKPTLSRQEAARVAGQRSAEVRRAKHGTAQPRSERSSNEAPNVVDNRSVTTFAERRSNVLEPPDPDPDPDPDPNPDPREREDLRASFEQKPEKRTEPQSRSMPISSSDCTMDELKRRIREDPTADLERKCSEYLRDPFASTFDPPKLWPETQAMAACFADSYGNPHRRLGDLPRDNGLATLLAILGAGITCREYFQAVTLSLDDEWFGKLKSPGLTTLTLEQVRRMLAEAEERGAA
jgi:hypothetical protein